MNPTFNVCHLLIAVEPGGMERGVLNVATSNIPSVHQYLLCIRGEGSLRDVLPDNAKVQSLGFTKGFHLRGVWQIARYLRQNRIDILHTRNQTALIWGGLANVLCPGIKHIHSEHGTPVEVRPIARWLARRADLLMTVSPAMIDEMRAFYRLPPDREIVVIPNGVDTEKFRPIAHEKHESARKGGSESGRTFTHGIHGTARKTDEVEEEGAHEIHESARKESIAHGIHGRTRKDHEQRPTNAPTHQRTSAPQERTHSARSATLRENLGLSEDTILFACVGRMDENKNQQLTIRAFADFAHETHETSRKNDSDRKPAIQNPEPRTKNQEPTTKTALLLIGDGPERGRLEELARSCSLVVDRCSENQQPTTTTPEPRTKNQEQRTNNLQPGPVCATDEEPTTSNQQLTTKIHFLGYRDDLPAILPQIDVLLLPSKREGMSNVILEANACGVPVLASDIPANRCLIREGENGYLLPLALPTEDTERHGILFQGKSAAHEIHESSRKGAPIGTQTTNQQQTTNNQQPATGSKGPVCATASINTLQPRRVCATDEQPTTNNQQRATSAWSQAMTDLANNVEKRRHMGTAARKLVTNEYSIDKMIERYEHLYRSLLA